MSFMLVPSNEASFLRGILFFINVKTLAHCSVKCFEIHPYIPINNVVFSHHHNITLYMNVVVVVNVMNN